MAYFNWEDFMKAAAHVANGELQGKLQARQEQMQQQAQETQNALGIQQLGINADQAQFGPREAYLGDLEKNVLPKLTGEGQTGMTERIARERGQIAQDRGRQAMLHSGLLPPHLRPFFQPQQTTQMRPPQYTGEATPQAPVGSVGSVGSDGSAPAPGPYAEVPPFDPNNFRPTPSGQAAPVVDQSTPLAHPRRFVDLGDLGRYEMRGIDKNQIAQYQKDRTAVDKYVTEYRGSPEQKQALDTYMQALPFDIQTDEDLQKAYGYIRLIKADEAGNALRAQKDANDEYHQGITDIEGHVDRLRKHASSPAFGAAEVGRIRAIEKRLAAKFPDRFDAQTDTQFLGFEDQLKDYDAATDPKRKAAILKEIATGLKDETPPEHIGQEANAVQRVLASLPLRSLKDKKKVIRALQVAGLQRAAADVEKNGVPEISVYRADKELQQWFGQAHQWAGMKPDEQDVFLQQGLNLAEASGQDTTAFKKLLETKLHLSPQQMTPYQRAQLEESRQNREVRWAQLDLSRDRFNIYQDKMKDAKVAAAVNALLRNKQHDLDHWWHLYDAERRTTSKTDAEIATGDDRKSKNLRGYQGRIDGAWRDWSTAYKRVQGVTPEGEAPFGSAPAESSAAPAVPGTNPWMQKSPAEIQAELKRRGIR